LHFIRFNGIGARMPKARHDSENVNYRPDPKINWGLWLAVRATGRKKQHIIAEGVVRELDTIRVGGKLWSDIWHVEEGVRELNFLRAMDRRRLEVEEEERLQFVDTFLPFFVDENGVPNEDRIRVLWPNLDGYLDKWKASNRLNSRAIGEAMAVLLKDKGGKKVPKEWIEHAAVRPS
jgi:hypothetical protein